MRSKEPCGCVHDGHKWLTLCPAHAAEEAAIHARWLAEHDTRAPAEPADNYEDLLS